jgi:RNA polymerase sigma-70 factor (ECF subfamily)
LSSFSEESTARSWCLAADGPEWTITVVEPDQPRANVARFDHLDDASLVAASVDGQREAFDVIVERHRRAVYQVCYRFVNNHEDASDLAQETFVRAWRGLRTFKGQAALSTWLYRIAVNVSLNRVSARPPATEPIDSDRFVDTRAEMPGAELERIQRAAAVRRAIASLPDKQRATLILRTYQELSHQEIADILGSSVGAVKANFFHALNNLKKRLGSEP